MRTLVVLIVVVAACALGVSLAVAHVKYYPTTFRVEYTPSDSGGVFSGEFASVNEKCNANRKVVVTISGDEVIGQGSSDSQGNFEFPATGAPHGLVEAEAKQVRIAPKTRKHKHFCLAGRTHVTVHH